MRSLLLQFVLLATWVLADDITVYSDAALAAGWENWSWSSDINFAATDIFEGSSSISVNSQAWSALSVKLEGTFLDYQGLRFDIAVRAHSGIFSVFIPLCVHFIFRLCPIHYSSQFHKCLSLTDIQFSRATILT
jgi:hypothetical protein